MRRRPRMGRSVTARSVLAAPGRLAAAYPWWVVGFWVVVVGALNIAIPQIEQTAAEKSAAIVPADLPSTQAIADMARDFGNDPSTAVGSVVMAGDNVIGPAEERYYSAVVQRLLDDREHVSYVLDMFGNPATRDYAVSPDGKAITLLVAERGAIGTAAAHRATEAVRHHLDAVEKPAGLQTHFSGPAPVVVDEFTSLDTSMVVITAVSVLLITVLMVMSYRSVIAALVPLLTIGVSLAASRAVVSGLGDNGALALSTLTVTLMTALVLAAGTDYAIFQMAAYHDGRRKGLPSRSAVGFAGLSVGEVLTASALTIAASATAMLMARNGMFTTSGPPIAIGLVVTLAVALTFTPAMMAILGRHGRIEPRPSRDFIWRRRGRFILRRSGALAGASLLLLILLAVPVVTFRANGDDNAMQLHPTDSSRGYDLVAKHYGANEIVPEFLIIRSDHDMRTTTDLAALDRVASAVTDLPNVAYVRSLTRPDGRQLPESAIGYQAALIAGRLADAGTQIGDARPDLERLTQGMTALRDGAVESTKQLPELVSGVNQVVDLSNSVLDLLPLADNIATARTADGQSLAQVLARLEPQLSSLQTLVSTLNSQRQAIDSLSRALAPYASLQPSAQCLSSPLCMQGRSLFAQLDGMSNHALSAAFTAAQNAANLDPDDLRTVSSVMPDLRAGLSAISTLTASLGGRSPESIRSDLTRLRDGMGQLTSGMDQLAQGLSEAKTGTDTVVSMTDQLRSGLDEASGYLSEMGKATSQGPGAGFYLPRSAFEDPRLVAGSKMLMSSDGRVARMLVIPSGNPYGEQATSHVSDISTTAEQSLKGSGLSHARVDATGLTSITSDLIAQSEKDFLMFGIVALAAVFVILVALLRSLLAPFILVATVLLSFLSAAGISVLVWQHIIGIGLHWSVLPVSFMSLVAVGADYSMLFASRVRENSSSGTTSAILRTFGSTGRVITTAGIVFAVTMFALMSGSVILLLQTGFTIGIGLLLDIAVVRTVLVPSVLHVLGSRIWWPSSGGGLAVSDGATSTSPSSPKGTSS